MKFQPDQLAGTNVITRHDPLALWVGNTRFGHSLLVPWTGSVRPWPPRRPEQLTPADFDAVLALAPELVIFGSGPRQRFVPAALVRALIDRRIGPRMHAHGEACSTISKCRRQRA